MADSTTVELWKDIIQDARGNILQNVELKDEYARVLALYTRIGGFAESVMRSLKATELSTFERPEDGKTLARTAFQLTASEEMLNAFDVVHGGCIAYLIDVCSAVTLSLFNVVQGEPTDAVSQAINTNYHSGAPRDAKLEIISLVTAVGNRTASVRTEIWDVTNHSLVASGIHTMMRPNVAKVKL